MIIFVFPILSPNGTNWASCFLLSMEVARLNGKKQNECSYIINRFGRMH